jgi:hypothetical protein
MRLVYPADGVPCTKALLHLAQMGSAAIERVDLYARRSASPALDPGAVREMRT